MIVDYVCPNVVNYLLANTEWPEISYFAMTTMAPYISISASTCDACLTISRLRSRTDKASNTGHMANCHLFLVGKTNISLKISTIILHIMAICYRLCAYLCLILNVDVYLLTCHVLIFRLISPMVTRFVTSILEEIDVLLLIKVFVANICISDAFFHFCYDSTISLTICISMDVITFPMDDGYGT